MSSVLRSPVLCCRFVQLETEGTVFTGVANHPVVPAVEWSSGIYSLKGIARLAPDNNLTIPYPVVGPRRPSTDICRI
jgi:hypothetical protein